MFRRGAKKNIGYFLVLKKDVDKLYYMRWSYEDTPILDTLPLSFLESLASYRQFCGNGEPVPCLFRAKIIRVWKNTTPRSYDVVLRVLRPDMITKVVNYALRDALTGEKIESLINNLKLVTPPVIPRRRAELQDTSNQQTNI